MNPCRRWFRLSWLRFTLTPALLGCLAACGGSDAADPAAGAALAVSSSPRFDDAATTKAAISKPDPASRPGAEAPLDSAPDRLSKLPGSRLFATGFEDGVSLSRDLVGGGRYQQLSGGDTTGYQFPITLGTALSGWPSRINAEVGGVPSLVPEHFATASLGSVTGRDGLPTRAMVLHSKAKSHAIDAQEISLENAGLASDPVAYQRMWVKFDADTLARARQHGADRFYQTFWEVRSNGDFWLRLKLQMGAYGSLIWVAKANGIEADRSGNGGEPSWITRLDDAPVTLADEASAAGWHKVEIWLDAVSGRFKVSIDDRLLVDRGDVRPVDGGRIDTWRMMMVGSTVAPIARVLFDDLEFWSAPPADAFQK